MAWSVDFYEDARGDAPLEEFLDRLPKKHRAKLLGLIAKLKEHGPTLPFPYPRKWKAGCGSFGLALGRLGFAFFISRTRIRNLSCCTEWSRTRKSSRHRTLKQP